MRNIAENSNWLAPLIVLVWTFIEGETIVIFMGYWAQDGRPNVLLIMLAAFLGSLAGDQTWFFVGRYRGRSFIATRPFWKAKAERVYNLLHRHSNWLIVGFRFLYGLRNITPFALGMSPVSTKKFVALNVIGAAVWSVTFTMVGYGLAHTVSGLDTIKHLKDEILIGLISIVVVLWVLRTYARHRQKKKLAAGQTTQDQPKP